MGVVTPVGVGIPAFWNSLTTGRSGVGPITHFDASTSRVRIAAEVKDAEFNAAKYVSNPKSLKLMSRASRFAVASTQMALDQSGIELDKLDPATVGVCMGSAPDADPVERTGRHFIRSRDEQDCLDMKRYWDAGERELDPMDYLRRLPNMPACQIAINFQVQGPNSSVATACAAGTQAIGDAYHCIQRGDATVMFAGGSDARVHPDGLIRFGLLGALSHRNDYPQAASRPFDCGRDGFVLGEGAGVVVLEDMEHAKKRSANILAEVAGFGSSADACRLTDSHPEARGGLLAISAALREGRIRSSEVGYINAHGTSTKQNDTMETLAIKRAFGDDAYRIPVSSTKSMTGHLISSAGAIEFICCVLAIQHGLVPPTINYEGGDESCDLDYVPNKCREAKVNVAMSNSFGFGGQNAVIAAREV
jgi:3-oxoacyl-[acyl-carrier-protein] synthase II